MDAGYALVHRVLAVEQALVHVHVDHLRAALSLCARYLERLVVVAVEDELLVLRRTSDIAALANVHETERLRGNSELLSNGCVPVAVQLLAQKS